MRKPKGRTHEDNLQPKPSILISRSVVSRGPNISISHNSVGRSGDNKSELINILHMYN